MENVRTRPLSEIDGPAWRRALPQALILIYIFIGLIVYLVVPFLAVDWIKVPFTGGFLEQTMVFDAAAPSGAALWPAYQQGLRAGLPGGPAFYQLQAIDGQPVRSAQELRDILAKHHAGDTVSLQALGANSEKKLVSLALIKFPAADQLAYFYLPYIIGLVYLVTAIWVFSIRRAHASGRAFSAFAVSAALAIGLLFDTYTTHMLSWLWVLAVTLSAGSAVVMALNFPREDPVLLRRRPLLTVVAGIAGLVVTAFALVGLYDSRHPAAFQLGKTLLYGLLDLGLAFLMGWFLFRRNRLAITADREQVRLGSIAAVASYFPLCLWLASDALFHAPPFSPLLIVLLAVFPVVAGFSLQRYRLIQSDLALSFGVRYGLLTVLIAVGYGLIAAGLGLILGAQFAPNNPVVAGLLFFVMAIALNPLRTSMQGLVDRVLFRNKRAFQDRLQTFSGELTRVVDLRNILRVLRRYVADSLAPSELHIFVYDPLTDLYCAAPDDSGQITSDLRFPMISGLVIRMGEQHAPLSLGESDALPPMLEPDRTRLVLLGATAFVPLPGRQRLTGWLALGPRLSGEPYTSIQLSFAEALCDQAALAIERAQVVANMENRVRQMDVLTRVAQGVNITLTLDDILELVYAQTVQIIPATYFYIMLYDRELDVYLYSFFLEKDDRLTERENRPVPVGQALEQEVIRQRRVIMTDDYQRECQKRGIITQPNDLVSWMAVPLNAGKETIGALSLGHGDPTVEYTPEQQGLLQAISDQVAGALVKARLLQETERRAHQLTSLNEVTRQLTSTLETEPLLQSILQSAVDILNCEAGSLLLVDDASNELVFRSVVSPVASDLLNLHMPVDRGVVGKSVKTGQPIIVNDVTRYPEWFSKVDKETGFITRALLVIPLMIKDRVIGVIEVINKEDGTIFSIDDQELLSAFASQAAVAIENARLYTNTDQALAARVDELSVMQRIDRELNASLDTARAMRITLDWAMRQSGATAGLVGIIQGEESDGIQVVASQGYSRELEPYQAELLSAEDYQFQETILSGLPARRPMNGSGPRTLLEGGHSQALIPIRRESGTIGLLLLESLEANQLSDDAMSFLVRLCDHASIAISNAQLYSEVQQANLAKSDFVSFVAHELKNPMTSVKGYTELISAGAVGPITDGQSNFLGTIRSNIDRMNTLVSDLNDMSKIEVGRLRLEFKSLRLEASIETVIRSTRKQLEEKQQTLNLAVPATLPNVWADRVRLEQVLVNLVSNANKYTPSGGVIEISAERHKNEWDASGAAEVVHVWVKDNGIGIAEEDQRKIFQKFFRADDPKTREVTGTGLGLNITKSLVEMQGGQIWFESEYRKGTIFHFTVPVSES